jgi:drug/metabolite transporter (DMT)-like permease
VRANGRVYKADGLLLLTAVIWGAAFVAQRVGMEQVGPLTFNGIRFALGAVALLPLVLRSAPRHAAHAAAVPGRKPGLARWGGLLAGAVLFAGATLQQVGLVYTTAGKAGFITGLYVVIVPFLGLLWGQRTDAGTWLGAGLAAVGLYFLSVTESFTIAYGDLLELVGAFLWAGHVHIVGWLAPRTNPVKLACGQFAVCSVLSLAGAGLTETVTLEAVRAAAVPILYGGLMSVGIAYTLQVVAQKDAPPAHASIILSLESVFAALAGWAVLDETLGLRAAVGCLLMFAGFLLAQLWPTSPAPAGAPASASAGD